MGMMIPRTVQIQFLKGTSRQPLISSLSTLLFHDDSYLASLHAWERQYGEAIWRFIDDTKYHPLEEFYHMWML